MKIHKMALSINEIGPYWKDFFRHYKDDIGSNADSLNEQGDKSMTVLEIRVGMDGEIEFVCGNENEMNKWYEKRHPKGYVTSPTAHKEKSA
jgi:hypothetical protein